MDILKNIKILRGPPGNFRFITLPPEILQICATPHGKSKLKNQDPLKFHISFS